MTTERLTIEDFMSVFPNIYRIRNRNGDSVLRGATKYLVKKQSLIIARERCRGVVSSWHLCVVFLNAVDASSPRRRSLRVPTRYYGAGFHLVLPSHRRALTSASEHPVDHSHRRRARIFEF